MTNRAQITRQAARDGVPAPTVERDYVLAHIIAALGAIDASHGLVFKGGTARFGFATSQIIAIRPIWIIRRWRVTSNPPTRPSRPHLRR